MRQTALITGGSGLLALNWALTIRDRYSVTLGFHKRKLLLADIQACQIDLEFIDHLVCTFETIQPQIVIHTAGFTSIEACEANPCMAQHVNVDLAANVAQACVQSGVQLVHISTDHLFSGSASLVDESYPLDPKNVYGRTKVEAEARVLEIYPCAMVIRTNFYGWGPSYRRSFSDLIIESLRTGSELTLFQDVFYTPILIETLANAVQDLINMKASGIFHVVGDERISKHEFGLKIARNFQLDAGLIKLGYLIDQVSLVQRPRDMSLSNQKTCNLLGRKLGGVDEHIAKLHRQEQNGIAQEIQNL